MYAEPGKGAIHGAKDLRHGDVYLRLGFIHPRASPLIFLGRGGHYAFMLRLLLGSLISAFKTRRSLGLENLALRQQLSVLQRSVKRPRLSNVDRGFWVLLRRFWTDWARVLVIVKPGTVVRWHRSGFKRYWTWKSRRRRPGRPGVAPEVTRADPEHVFSQSALASASRARRAHEARHIHFPGSGVQ